MAGIQAEIKQRKPFQSLEEETLIALARTSDQLGRQLDSVLKQHGLTGTQYNVLRILRGAGKSGLACSEIGERMVTRDPDITRLLDRMERAGLCTRARDQKDRRVIVVRISSKGMFASGSATVEPAFFPILERIGEAVNEEPGPLVISGHSDNIPIRSVKFPSNWHLSVARAKAVLEISDRTYVLGGGQLRMQGSPAELSNNPEFVQSFLGGHAPPQPARS